MKIALIGYGKMGKVIEKQALETGHEIVLRISRSNKSELTPENLTRADVAIEFSLPETAYDNIAFCLQNGVPVVSGTTGWLDQVDEVTTLCHQQQGAFFYASNFSIGVNLFFALNRYLAALMKNNPQYDVDMEEIHHTQKLDYPSGTAISLAKDIIDRSGTKESWEAKLEESNTEQADSPATSSLIISSKRTGKVPGTHHIRWASATDQIEISHIAHSRAGFAAGALQAAGWIIGKQGCFGMEDMLKTV